MYLKTFETSVLKYMNLILLIFLSATGLAWEACLKKTRIRLELLTDIDMLLRVDKGTRGEICHAIHRYAKAIINRLKIAIKTLNHHTSCI